MKKETIKKFLKPDWRKILIFVIFLFIALAASTQSWVFSGKDAGIPKPPLFDVLAPVPFWPIWVYLVLPLAPILAITNGEPVWLFWTIEVIYFYLLSSLIIFLWNKRKGQKGQK